MYAYVRTLKIKRGVKRLGTRGKGRRAKPVGVMDKGRRWGDGEDNKNRAERGKTQDVAVGRKGKIQAKFFFENM